MKCMRLIIGANASGKLEYVKSLGYTESDILYCENIPAVSSGKVLYKLNHLIDKLIQNEKSPVAYVEQMLSNMPYEVIVCDEIGGGVVPISRYERDLREEVGRACCKFAARAAIVERIYCGIPQTIKCETEDKKPNDN